MEQSIRFGVRGHANSRLATRVLRVSKRLVGRVAALRLEGARDWARSMCWIAKRTGLPRCNASPKDAA